MMTCMFLDCIQLKTCKMKCNSYLYIKIIRSGRLYFEMQGLFGISEFVSRLKFETFFYTTAVLSLLVAFLLLKLHYHGWCHGSDP
jgi:hypothetical protein